LAVPRKGELSFLDRGIGMIALPPPFLKSIPSPFPYLHVFFVFSTQLVLFSCLLFLYFFPVSARFPLFIATGKTFNTCSGNPRPEMLDTRSFPYCVRFFLALILSLVPQQLARFFPNLVLFVADRALRKFPPQLYFVFRLRSQQRSTISSLIFRLRGALKGGRFCSSAV